MTFKYPDCFRTYNDCKKCPSFGSGCIEDIDEIDRQHAIEDGENAF